MGGDRLRQGLVYARMREAKIVVHMVQNELLPQALLPFAEGGHPSPARGDMLADAQVDALAEGGVDLPAAGRQYLLDRLQRAESDPVRHADETATPHGLDHLCIEQPGPWPPAWLRRRALYPLAGRLAPLAIVRQQRRHGLAKAIRQEQRGAV